MGVSMHESSDPLVGDVCIPLPIPNLRQVLAVLVDVLLMLDELVLELLL